MTSGTIDSPEDAHNETSTASPPHPMSPLPNTDTFKLHQPRGLGIRPSELEDIQRAAQAELIEGKMQPRIHNLRHQSQRLAQSTQLKWYYNNNVKHTLIQQRMR